MKTSLLILLILTTNVSLTQNIWEPISFPDTLYPQTINAQNNDYIFVTAQGPSGIIYLLRSNDDGLTWETLNLETYHFNEFFTINYNSEGVLFLGNRQNIFRSFDNGNNFDTVYTNYDTQDVVTKIRSFYNNETYALGRSKIIRSIDNGNTWDTIYLSTLNPWQYFEDITIGEAGSIFTVCLDYDSVVSGFYRSLDNGESWEHIGITDTDLQTINVNSEGKLIVSGEDLDGIYSSSDFGENWTPISNLTTTIMEFCNNKLIAGSDVVNSSGCWISYDWGNNWIDMVDSTLNPLVQQISISPSNHIYIQCSYFANSNQLFKSIFPILFINDKISTSNFEIFPNPASNEITISNNNVEKILKYDIYNSNGQKIQSDIYLKNTIDVSKFKPGMYILELTFENKKMRRKLVVE